ncbi:MAG: hypothetical protein ACM3UU_06430 [Ignavibacteriales bacterium]
MKNKICVLILIIITIITFAACGTRQTSNNNSQIPAAQSQSKESLKGQQPDNKDIVIPESEINLDDYYEYNFTGNKVKITSKSDKKDTYCTIPTKLVKSSKSSNGDENPLFTFLKKSEQNAIKSDKQFEKRYVFTLKMKLGEAEYISGDKSGIYIDIAKINITLQFKDSKWVLTDSKVIPKYTSTSDKSPKNFTMDEARFSNVYLFDVFTNSLKGLGKNTLKYKDDISGDYNIDDLQIEVSNYRVCGLTVKTDKYKTSRSLKVGDSKERALELYGLPDSGYYEDSEWVYYFYRNWSGDEKDDILNDDYFKITYTDSKVSELNLAAYIPID